jgi:hypothetical protein
MTKGRVALTSADVTEERSKHRLSAIFITLGGPKAHEGSVEKHLPQRLKPDLFCLVDVRAEARTLQKK